MTSETFFDGKVTLHSGDCLDVLDTLAENSIDSVCCDPPYHLTSIVKRFGSENAAPSRAGKTGAYVRASAGFMGKIWDGGDIAFRPETWAKVLRALKPGAHLVAFSGTRTYHRMACAIEDAGFEIRDQLAWCYGSGFPKSHNVSKNIDKHLFNHWIDADASRRAAYDSEMHAAESIKNEVKRAVAVARCDDKWHAASGFAREVIGTRMVNDLRGQGNTIKASQGKDAAMMEHAYTAPGSPEAAEWDGWGTALKPAWEPICLARKPLIGTVVENVLAHGTGAINCGGCAVGDEARTYDLKGNAPGSKTLNQLARDGGNDNPNAKSGGSYAAGAKQISIGEKTVSGRWPANLITDGSAEVLAAFPESNSAANSKSAEAYKPNGKNAVYGNGMGGGFHAGFADSGSAARFFYAAKADSDDRLGSKHPTVKPVDLMQWLVRLVTPTGGTVLDLFAGTGTTGEAAYREGMRAVLIEREPEYQADIRRRMALVLGGPDERRFAAIKAGGKAEQAGPLFAFLNK